MTPARAATLFAVPLLAALCASTARGQEPGERLGPIVLETDDGGASLRPTLVTQLRGAVSDRDAGDGVRETTGSFDLQRLRVGAAATAGEVIRARLQLELAPRGPELIDAWLEARLAPRMRLRVGQMKIPFTRVFEQSIARLSLVDWPITARAFGGEHQLGVMLHDTDHEGGGFEYAVGLFAGENRRGAHARALPRRYGEPVGNPSSFSNPRAPSVPHPELLARLTHRAAGVPGGSTAPTRVQDAEDRSVRHALSLSGAFDFAPERGRDFTLRVAPEARIEAAGVSATVVAYFGLAPTDTSFAEPAMAGGLIELAWRPHEHVELAARLARVAFLPALSADAERYAASMIPDDPAAMPGWSAQYGDVGSVTAEQELTVGLTVPIFERSVAWQTDVAWLHTERSSGARDDVRLRTQLQLAL